MTELNLQYNDSSEQRILDYLKANASVILADKINNGVQIELDGKQLINKKTLAGFMKYACEEAKKQAEKGKNYACINDSTVFGWAIHYFEEDGITGTLYNLDGTEYNKPVVKEAPRPVKPAAKKEESRQYSLFDELFKEEDNADETDTLSADCDDKEDVEEEQLEIKEQPIVEEEKPKGSPLYIKYQGYQAEQPTAVVCMRLGDFYEVFGERAVEVANELDLTLTGRDCGLAERVPMIGFPYHVSEVYFGKIAKRHDIYIVENDEEKQFIECVSNLGKTHIDQETGEIVKESLVPDYLYEMFGEWLEMK